MRVNYSKHFVRQLQKAPQSVQISFRDRLTLFIENRHHPLLHYHRLKGKLQNYYSINITGDWRALFRTDNQEDQKGILFVAFGTHSELYSS